MNFVQKLEECLRDLGTEARKHNAGVPGVKEAAERATLKLRQLQTSYVAAVRKANKDGSDHPTTSIFQSSDLLHPFLWATNYPNANPSLLDTSFRAMKLLMEADAIVYSDSLDLIRVWTIQAQVGVSYYRKIHCDDSEEKKSASSSSSGGWFSWGSSGSSSKEGNTGDTQQPSSTTTSKPRNAVSSSSGQSGLSQANGKDTERRALEILSCLLQLLELLRNISISENNELWTNSVALCCLWLRVLPARHTVRQAAQSTLAQVLNICLVDGAVEPNSSFVLKTWDDLLSLTGDIPKKGLVGAFRTSKSEPLPEFALELLTRLGVKAVPEELMPRVCQVTMTLLQKYKKMPVERYLRTAQWTNQILQVKHAELQNECVELFTIMCKVITLASDACRSNHDFEDGYVYVSNDESGSVGKEASSSLLGVTLFPDSTLYKAAFVIELIFHLAGSVPELLEAPEIVSSTAEALSDFATIGASCQSHSLQLVEYCESIDLSTSWQPALIRHAEQALATGSLLNSAERDAKKIVPGVLGEALWTALQAILRMDEILPSIVVEPSFASSLAVLQHYLKRFAGCKALVQLSLRGYVSLADVCFSSAMPRKALLTSLCKLSLPAWGKMDSNEQLQDHHVRSLLCLFRILHIHHSEMESDWEIVLVTLQELSNLAIASNKLTEEAYHAALAVAVVFGRLASFSACLSNQSYLALATCLSRIAPDVAKLREPLSHAETMPASSKGEPGTIGGKIVNMGVRAIYGANNDGAETGVTRSEERTKFTFYDEYREDFVLRMSNSDSVLRMPDGTPFCLALLVDVLLANSFRYTECGQTISELLSQLAASSPSLREFCMDTLAMITTVQITDSAGPSGAAVGGPRRLVVEDPMQSQLLAVETIMTREREESASSSKESRTTTVPQSTLLGPLCKSIRETPKSDIAEASLETLSTILESTGHNLNGDVWFVVIDSVASLSGDPSRDQERTKSEWDSCCLAAFRCLKLIVDEFSEEVQTSVLSSSRPNPLLDCCASFGSSQHDINTSLTAIGLLWTIADQDAGPDGVSHALSKLADLTSDDRLEIRNAAVNTLFSCVVGKGGVFTSVQWKMCFEDIVFNVYRLILSKLQPSEPRVESEGSAPKSTRYRVSLHHSRDSTSKQWISTQVLVLRGLARVLRGNFAALLATVDEESGNGGTPWFLDAWVLVLDFSYEAATQKAERETLDLCSVGSELILDCCQLASHAGIQAAITPARVGTNMEVVNGALRSVRESKENVTPTIDRTRSQEAESMRESLFLEAFEGAHSLKGHFESETPADDCKLQVMHRCCAGLGKLYDCGKNHELVSRAIRENEDKGSPKTLLDRFLEMVVCILRAATVEPNARYLNQAQRCSIELLETMANDGKPETFRVLVALAGISFFVRKDSEIDGQKNVSSSDSEANQDLVGFELSVIVSKAISKDSLSAITRMQVLEMVLELFLKKNSTGDSYHKSAYYKRMVPIFDSGLEATAEIENADRAPRIRDGILDEIWTQTTQCVTKMLSPVSIGNAMSKLPRVVEVTAILDIIVRYAPRSRRTGLTSVLTFGARNAFDVAIRHDEFASDGDDEMNKKSRKHRDEVLKLFVKCISAASQTNPDDADLHSLIRSTFNFETTSDSIIWRRFYEECSIAICRCLVDLEGIEPVVIALFSSLCHLLSSENNELKAAATSLCVTFDLSSMLSNANSLRQAAEQRAAEAEERARRLSTTVEELRRANSELRREIAILEASASTGI